jgi:excinuclease ABC subunit C
MFDIEENLKKLPDCPGVYLHKDKLGRVIYVGKAISLKNRVRQYFQSSYQNSSPKVKALVQHISEFEYITCGSEMEALILECNLIKKYMPKYNVLLRDDKTYPYIEVTVTEPYPRVLKTRRLLKDGNRYFGPFSDAGAVNQIVELLQRMYALKRCSATEFPDSHRPCLNYHIQACRGVCTGQVDRKAYMESIQQIIDFLSGKDKPLVQELDRRMREASEDMRYEEAAKWRDDLLAVKALKETQRVTMINDQDFDIVYALKDADHAFVVLFPVRSGKLSGRETFQIQADESDSRKNMVSAFIKQYYSQWATVPPEILVEEEPDEKELLEEFLSRDRKKVHILVPKRGSKRALMDLTRRDINEMTKTIEDRASSRQERERLVYDEMQKVMQVGGFTREEGRSGKPYRVESYDISNTNGVDSVGAMVVFEGLEPVKKDYRRFKIRTIEGADDYGSLQEVLYRRFRRAQKGSRGFQTLPDIILMDGGRGQVTAALKVIRALGLTVPVAGMAKDDRHRTRALVFEDGREIDLAHHSVLFRYCGTIQEEVHRFAIDYHHSLHSRNSFHSELDDIPGIGPKRRNDLLYYFKSVDAIRKASEDELMQVPSVSRQAAENIISYFASHPAGKKEFGSGTVTFMEEE